MRKHYPINWRGLIINYASVLVILLCSFTAFSQQPSGSITIDKPICDKDGKLTVNVQNMTPPLSFVFETQCGTRQVTSNTLAGVLDNIECPVYYVSVSSLADSTRWSEKVNGMDFVLKYGEITNNSIICPDTTTSVNAFLLGGTAPYSVEWHRSDPAMDVTGNPINLSKGYWETKATDANGCKSSSNVYIFATSNIHASVSTTPAACTNGTAEVMQVSGGLPPYSYEWSNGAGNTAKITGLRSGSYQVDVIDANGCKSDSAQFFYISQNPQITVNPVIKNATCLEQDGSIKAFASGGKTPYTYNWESGQTGNSITGLGGGKSYTVHVVDANGCIGTGYAYVDISSPVTVNYSSTKSDCVNPTGSATLTAMGGTVPYSYEWNTYPISTTNSISGKGPGQYGFKVTDAAGCVRTGAVSITTISDMNAYIESKNPVCPANTGDAKIQVWGSNPPFTYVWNGAPGGTEIHNVPLGYYTCQVTDALGCKIIRAIGVYQTSPVHVGFDVTNTSCIYSEDGKLHVRATGGKIPYTYHWSNGFAGENPDNLKAGYYRVQVTDADGCANSGETYVATGPGDDCYCTLTGTVYHDENGNCAQDGTEPGIQNVQIHCSGFGYAYTNADGKYEFKVPSGSYTLSESIQYLYPLAACETNGKEVTVTAASGCTNVNNFGNYLREIHDIHLLRTANIPPRPGFDYNSQLVISNRGTLEEDLSTYAFRHDGQMQLISISDTSYSQPDGTNEPNYYTVPSGNMSRLLPGESRVVYFNYKVSQEVPLGTFVETTDTASATDPITNWELDNSPWNNVLSQVKVTVGSYDPNFKEVSPAGEGPEGFIELSDTSLFDYTIHFQNEGTYYAEKVVIVDTLDANLDWSTLIPGFSDHSYSVTVDDNGVATFVFDNIHLPWKAQTEPGSCGYVSYTIKRKSTVGPGDKIRNTGYIYFDFNEPVITNTTVNTIIDHTAIGEDIKKSDFAYYPNPGNGKLNIELKNGSESAKMSMIDLLGRKVFEAKLQQKNQLDVSSLKSGVYIIKVEMNGVTSTGKYVIR